MKTHKKPLFTLVQSDKLLPQKNTLSDLDSKLNYPENINKIIALPVKEVKLHHGEYKDNEYNSKAKIENNREMRFIFPEMFESEHHKRQISLLKEELAFAKESNKVKELLSMRLKQMAKIYPHVQLDLNDITVMPNKIKKYLFAPPLILTQDNAIMLWEDGNYSD